MYRSKAEACGPTTLTSPLALATSAIIEITLVSPAPGGAGPTTFCFGAGAGLAAGVVDVVVLGGAGLGGPVEAVAGGGAGFGAILVFEAGGGGRPLA